VPAPAVMVKALEAARRVNDYATASRVFEGLRFKVESKEQYQQYLDELKDIREELGKCNTSNLFASTVNSCRRHPQGGALQRAGLKPLHSNHSLLLLLLLLLLRHTFTFWPIRNSPVGTSPQISALGHFKHLKPGLGSVLLGENPQTPWPL
jgi:hypothetical protein